MGQIIKLTESQLKNVIQKVINENQVTPSPCDTHTFNTMLKLIKGGDEFKMQNIGGDGNMMVIEIPRLYEPCTAVRTSVFK